MENSHIKVGTNIHKNSKNYLDHENLGLIMCKTEDTYMKED